MSVGGVVLRSDALASVLITILDEVLTIIVKFAEYVDYKWPYSPVKVFIVYYFTTLLLILNKTTENSVILVSQAYLMTFIDLNCFLSFLLIFINISCASGC